MAIATIMKSKNRYIVEVWLLGLDCTELVKKEVFDDYEDAKAFSKKYHDKGYDTNIVDKSAYLEIIR